MSKVPDEEVRRLADNVRAKILAKAAVIAVSEGEITIRIFRRGVGFDIKLDLTID